MKTKSNMCAWKSYILFLLTYFLQPKLVIEANYNYSCSHTPLFKAVLGISDGPKSTSDDHKTEIILFVKHMFTPHQLSMPGAPRGWIPYFCFLLFPWRPHQCFSFSNQTNFRVVLCIVEFVMNSVCGIAMVLLSKTFTYLIKLAAWQHYLILTKNSDWITHPKLKASPIINDWWYI